MSRKPTPGQVWAGLLGAGFLFELWALVTDRKGDTLSERVRIWARIRTRPGRWGFVLSWAALTAWFVPHVLADPNRDLTLTPESPVPPEGCARPLRCRRGSQ